MVRQEAIKRVFVQIIENKISPTLLDNGFKYSKTNTCFTKSVNSFDIVMTPSTSFPTITYNDDIEKLLFHLRFNITIKCLKFEKWYELNFSKKTYLQKEIETVNCYAEINFDTFNDSDFYTPTPSQQFKNSVRVSLTDNQSSESSEGLITFLKNSFPLLLKKTQNLCTDVEFFNDKKDSLELTFANLLIFLKDFEKAKLAYQSTYHKLIESLNNFRIEQDWDNSYYIFLIKTLAKDGKRFLNLDFEVPNYLPLLSSFKNSKIELPNTNIKYNEAFSIIKHSKKIVSFCITPDGRVIVGHENMNIAEHYITIWDKDGNLLVEKELPIEEGTWGGGGIYVGYIAELNLFFANRFIINSNLEIFTLELPVVPHKKSNLLNRFEIPLTYDPKAELFIAYYNYKTDKECFIVFYDKNYKMVKKLVVTLRPMDIIVEKQWILLYSIHLNYVSIIDYDGNEIVQLESNNVRDVNGSWGRSKFHAISKSNKYFFSFFYYVKSNLFDLESFKKDVLWAHTTYEKDYKELYYNDINHNFGLHPAEFSPNEKYIVGGADHGKYVAWTLPDKKRIELIPNEEYLKKMPDAEIYFIGDKKFLKNRGNEVRDILFWENGKYFSFVINNDLLIWNDSFEHISTVFDIGKVNYGKVINFYDKYIGLHNQEQFGRDELIILKNTSNDQ